MQPRKFRLFPLAFITGYLASSLALAQTDLPSPTALEITPLSKTTAIISANFPHITQDAVRWEVAGNKVEFNDAGKNGDSSAKDGWFSATLHFDFAAFVKSNQQIYSRLKNNQTHFFANGSRQENKDFTLNLDTNQLTFTANSSGKPTRFSLPLTESAIQVNRSFRIPLISLPLGIPSPNPNPLPINIPRSLMITDVRVVNDPIRTWSCSDRNTLPSGNPQGEWTFWSLMENINNGTSSTSDYIRALFKHWAASQQINSFNVPARPNVYQQIIDEWEARSGGDLRPEHSPFRLLGIVPRIDLRGGKGPYGGGEAGEGRLVFTLHDGNCNNLSKTIILEYKTPIQSCEMTRNWARKWAALPSSNNYVEDLANLTRVFTAAGANPQAPNGSAIGQIRTNEFLAGSDEWELREFVLPRMGGFFTQTDVKQEPHIRFNHSPLLAQYLNENWSALVGPPSAQHIVPLTYASTPFAAGSSPLPVIWDAADALLTIPTTPAPITPPPATIRDDAVFEFALNTCSGCHQHETDTRFAHLDYNSPPGQPAILSGFLTGISVPDPRNPAIMRHYNDLARRAVDLSNAANMSCDTDAPIGNQTLELFTRSRLNAVH